MKAYYHLMYMHILTILEALSLINKMINEYVTQNDAWRISDCGSALQAFLPVDGPTVSPNIAFATYYHAVDTPRSYYPPALCYFYSYSQTACVQILVVGNPHSEGLGCVIRLPKLSDSFIVCIPLYGTWVPLRKQGSLKCSLLQPALSRTLYYMIRLQKFYTNCVVWLVLFSI